MYQVKRGTDTVRVRIFQMLLASSPIKILGDSFWSQSTNNYLC